MKDTVQYDKIVSELMPIFHDHLAVKFCADFWLQLQLLDDVYDGDEISDEEALKLVKLSLIEIPSNPFYVNYGQQLQPLISSLYLQWNAANKLEEQKRDLEKAYMLRAFVIQLFHYCSAIMHGIDYADSVDFQGFYGETFTEYVKEFKDA